MALSEILQIIIFCATHFFRRNTILNSVHRANIGQEYAWLFAMFEFAVKRLFLRCSINNVKPKFGMQIANCKLHPAVDANRLTGQSNVVSFREDPFLENSSNLINSIFKIIFCFIDEIRIYQNLSSNFELRIYFKGHTMKNKIRKLYVVKRMCFLLGKNTMFFTSPYMPNSIRFEIKNLCSWYFSCCEMQALYRRGR